MNSPNKIVNYIGFKHIPVLLVMVIASLLRLWAFHKLPFMHDEFSALFRTGFDTFSSLIRDGVVVDAHPAGVQVFLWYWVKIFGMDAFWVKLPFALMGVGAVGFIYLIAKAWFNETAALITASWMAVMQFFIFYSQLARPYAAGLFALLLMVHIWTVLLQQRNPPVWRWIAFSIALTLVAFMHAFSLFIAGLVYISGFFVFSSAKRKPYLWSGLLATILYSPHIPIFWQQLKTGAIGGWLGAPDHLFLFDFFAYSFHYNVIFALVSMLLLLILFTRIDMLKKQINLLRVLGLSWFVVSFLTAYLYSLYRSPILQYSTLYFSFPFVLIVSASFVKKLDWRYNTIIVLVIMSTGSYSLIEGRRHYDLMYNQGFDQIARQTASDKQALGDSLLVAMRPASPRMQAFYLKHTGVNRVNLFSSQDDHSDLYGLLSSAQHYDYLAFAWTDYARLDWVEVAREYFPFVINYRNWFNAEYYLLSKNQHDIHPKVLEEELVLLDHNYAFDEVVLDSARHYGPLLAIDLDSITATGHNIVLFSTEIRAIDTIDRVHLVMEIRDAENGEVVHWQSGRLMTASLFPGQLQRIHSTNRIDGLRLPDRNLVVRSYIWNPEGQAFEQLDHKLRVRRQDKRILGLFEPL